MLKIIAPKGEVFPYIDNAKQYLLADVDAKVSDYFIEVRNPFVPVQIVWEYEGVGVERFLVEYATKGDFSDVLTVETAGNVRSVELYNLYKASDYFVRVTALDCLGKSLESAEGGFFTTALGPRVMNFDGICNVRDFGGYETLDGKKIVQGVAYRGGSVTPLPRDPLDTVLTEKGKAYMRDTLGIKTEIDLRSTEESGIGEESIIPGVKLIYATINGYDAAMKEPERYRKVFSLFADKNNYPLYYHCTAGSDRTGTVTFILRALLGESELACIKDHEFSSFSIYGERNTKTGESGGWFHLFYDRLMAEYEGKTLQEKVVNYLLSIGVTVEEMNNIKGIFFGEIPVK